MGGIMCVGNGCEDCGGLIGKALGEAEEDGEAECVWMNTRAMTWT